MMNLKKELDKELADIHFPIESFRLRWESAKDSRKKTRKLRRLYAVVITSAIVICSGGAGIYAGINYFQRRGSQLSPNEQEAYVDDLTDAKVNADTYSRELTPQERIRKDELTARYQSEGLYPKRKLLKISSPKEAQSDRVCFLPKTSTFYLPERELDDEDLLEIIDHDLMADYSLAQREGVDESTLEEQHTNGQKPSASKKEEIRLEEAISIAKETVANIYGEDALDSMRVETEKVTHDPESGNELISYLYITLTKEDGKLQYFLNMDLVTGEILSLDLLDEQDNFAENISPDTISDMDLIELIKQKACIFMGKGTSVQKAYAQIIKDSKGQLANGAVDYFLFMDDGKIINISYSMVTQRIYAFENLTQNTYVKYQNKAKEQCSKENQQYEYINLNSD